MGVQDPQEGVVLGVLNLRVLHFPHGLMLWLNFDWRKFLLEPGSIPGEGVRGDM